RPDLRYRRVNDDPLDEPLWIEVGGAGDMRVWAAHAVFAAILIGSLATHQRAADALVDSGSLEPAVLRVARSHDWGLGEHRTTSGVPTLVFEAPVWYSRLQAVRNRCSLVCACRPSRKRQLCNTPRNRATCAAISISTGRGTRPTLGQPSCCG